MNWKMSIWSIAFVLSLTLFASAVEVVLAPSKDNTIFEQTTPTSQRSNALGDLFVGRNMMSSSSIRRGLIQFNIASAIPSGRTITSASLVMRETTGNNGDQTVTLHKMSEDWGQGTSEATGMMAGNGAPSTDNDATWLYPFFNATTPASSTPWSAPGGPGGNFASLASASTIVDDNNGANQLFTWSSLDMINDVQSWLDNPLSNFGWLIHGNESAQGTAKRFNSSETAAFAPKLTITYVPEPGSLGMAAVVATMLGIPALVRRRRV